MFESPRTRSLRAQETELATVTTGFYTPPQAQEMSLSLVLASLRKYWLVTAAVSSILMAGIAYKTAKEPRIYRSGIQIAIELKSSATLAEKLTAAAVNANNAASDDRSTTLETTVQKLKSKTILKKAIDSIPDPKLRPSLDTVIQNLAIQTSQNTNILSISYTDTVPDRIVATLNALSNVYIDYGIKTKKARTDNSIAFIESQLPKSRERLRTSSKQLEGFRQKYRFIDPESSAKGLAEYRQEVVKQINENRSKYSQIQQQREQLNKQLLEVGLKSDNNLSTTMLTQDSAYQELFKKLNDLELIYSQEKLRLTDNSPILTSIKEKRDDVLVLLKNRAQQVLKREVPNSDLTNGGIANFSNNLAQNLANKQTEVESNLAAQTAQYDSLVKVYKQIELQIAQLPALQQQYTDLQRQYTIYSQELTAFLQKLQELRIADAEQVIPWTSIDPPEVPTIPIFPNAKQQLGLGAVGSLCLGILSALGVSKLRNSLNNRVDHPDTLKAMTGMPVLTLVPKVDDFELIAKRGGSAIKPVKNNRKNYAYWSFLEAMRMLVLDIGLMSDEEDRLGKVIAMTSAVSKEGKSTISFHTSITLAELGYKVLLVDVDLHKSSISELCRNSALFQSVNCASDAGLSDAILKGDTWENLIKKAPGLNLHVLFSGLLSVNSIALLNSPRFKREIERWRREYDYVIFDTPPIVGVSDTRLIAKLVDGLVYIVSLNIAKRQTIDRAIEIISSIQTPVLGLVINRADNPYPENHDYYHYNYKAREKCVVDTGEIENIYR